MWSVVDEPVLQQFQIPEIRLFKKIRNATSVRCTAEGEVRMTLKNTSNRSPMIGTKPMTPSIITFAICQDWR